MKPTAGDSSLSPYSVPCTQPCQCPASSAWRHVHHALTPPRHPPKNFPLPPRLPASAHTPPLTTPRHTALPCPARQLYIEFNVSYELTAEEAARAPPLPRRASRQVKLPWAGQLVEG